MGKKKILIVEDEKPIANALKLKLEHEGNDVELAHNGEDGINSIKNNKYDLVLLDIIMPKKNGFEVLESLKNEKIKTKVIMSTNLGQQEDIDKAKKLGAVDFFVKSNTPLNEVVEKVKKYLN